jgi:1-acylglycerone phosphate reductase
MAGVRTTTKQSVLVTGCSEGGIGYALVLEFQRRGVHVFATARNLSKMSSLQGLPNVTLLSLDVTSSSSIAQAVEKVAAHQNGRLDYLINNSGSQYVMPILDVDIEMAKQMYEVNVWGVVAVTKAFAPLVIEAKGSIINMASIAGCLYPPWMGEFKPNYLPLTTNTYASYANYEGLYAGSKSALATISETLRLEMQPLGVQVVTVITGAVSTKLHINAPDHHLPDSSFYIAASSEIAARVSNEDVPKHSKPEDFARSLVGDLLAGTSGKVYRGEMASTVRFASKFLPASFLVCSSEKRSM